jgi:hypothetical protein
MPRELPESEAVGRIADIYADVRRLWGVGYVSSLQRHLATRSGWLEWAWTSLAPAFESGAAQDCGWRACDEIELPELTGRSRADLEALGIGRDDEKAIIATCAAFVRVAPVNLMFAGLLRKLLLGEQSQGSGWSASGWRAPENIPEPRDMIDLADADEATRAALLRLATRHQDDPFVPGLYRILAHWPSLLQSLSLDLSTELKGEQAEAARELLLTRIDTGVDEVFSMLPAASPAPADGATEDVLRALATYRLTSPEMVMSGRMIAQSLPGETV